MKIKIKELINKFQLTKLKIKTPFAEAEIDFSNKDSEAAWELYVELITRIATQRLLPETGDEKTALESIHKLFEITREILKNKGRKCINFTKIAVIVLNQIIRPFTAKWHKISIDDGFKNTVKCEEFRNELTALQTDLRSYTRLLATLAQVEDITDLEESEYLNS